MVEVRCKSCLINFLHKTDGYYLNTLYSISYSKDIFRDNNRWSIVILEELIIMKEHENLKNRIENLERKFQRLLNWPWI